MRIIPKFVKVPAEHSGFFYQFADQRHGEAQHGSEGRGPVALQPGDMLEGEVEDAAGGEQYDGAKGPAQI